MFVFRKVHLLHSSKVGGGGGVRWGVRWGVGGHKLYRQLSVFRGKGNGLELFYGEPLHRYTFALLLE